MHRVKILGTVGFLGIAVLSLTACEGTYNVARDLNGNMKVTEQKTGQSFTVSGQDAQRLIGAASQGQQTQPQTAPSLSPAAAPAQTSNQPQANPSPAASGNLTGTQNVVVRLMDGRSPEERRTVEGNYEDTGVLKPGTKTWQRQVPAGEVALVFGVTFKDETSDTFYDDGFLKVYEGPTSFHVTVTDGAYKIVPIARAEGEVCVRYAQHVKEGWLMNIYDGSSKYNPAQICR